MPTPVWSCILGTLSIGAAIATERETEASKPSNRESFIVMNWFGDDFMVVNMALKVKVVDSPSRKASS